MTATVPDNRHSTLSSEQRLWAAVIVRALTDALWRDSNPGGKPSERVLFNGDNMGRRQATTIRDTAIFWLTTANRHFIDVCLMAGLEPDVVRVRARKILDAAQTDEQAEILASSISMRNL